jgi:DNA-binding PadR family transcriptional regulator
MDVKTLCLGLLSLEDACGYELKKRCEARFQHFFSAGYGSIYPALAELAEAGLVEDRAAAGDGRADRKVYRITAAGREHFRRSLHTMTPQHKLRSEFLAMLYFADLMDTERLNTVVDERLQELRRAESHIAGVERELGRDAPAGARFVAGFGVALARVAADYIEEHRHLLLERSPARQPEKAAAPARAARRPLDLTGSLP